MAYNMYSDVNGIYNLKGQWDVAYNAGDLTKANKIASDAQDYYKRLRDNGYGDVADQLQASNYTQSKAINDKWAKTNKTATRPYLYSLGQKYGMSQSDVDKIIQWDNDAQQLILGGKTVGTPDSVVDGVSYWSDTSVLDNAFNDYINRTGITLSDATLQAQHNNGISDKINTLWGLQTNDHNDLTNMYKKEYEDIKNTNPFTTEEAKAILAKYDLAGLQGRDNAVASGSASNGGNIDSYSAANAMRQQASLTNQGQMAVLEAHQQKIDNARSILEGLGAYQKDSYAGMQNTIGVQQTEAQRLFDNNETAKNNDVARKAQIAEVTGYSPDEWVVSNNPYMNDDGTIKDEYKNTDFSAVMAKAKASGNTATYNAAATARFYKIMSDYGKYGQYDDGNYIVPGQQETEARRQFNVNNDTVLESLKSDEKKTQINANATTSVANAQAEASKFESTEATKRQESASEAAKYAADQERGAGKDAIDAYVKYGYGDDKVGNTKKGENNTVVYEIPTEAPTDETWAQAFSKYTEKHGEQPVTDWYIAASKQLYEDLLNMSNPTLENVLAQLAMNTQSNNSWAVGKRGAQRILQALGFDPSAINTALGGYEEYKENDVWHLKVKED